MKNKKRVVIYTRVSTEDQKLDQQVFELEEFAKQRDWKVVKVFEEKRSAADKDRPGLKKAIALARERKVDVFLVWKFDRFARSVSMLVNTLEEFNGLGVEFVSLKDKIDTTTSVGKMTFAVIAAMAEMERDIMSERIKAGIEARRRSGKQIGRPSKGEALKNQILGLRVQRLSFSEIGRRLDIHTTTVSGIIKKYGEPEEKQIAF